MHCLHLSLMMFVVIKPFKRKKTQIPTSGLLQNDFDLVSFEKKVLNFYLTDVRHSFHWNIFLRNVYNSNVGSGLKNCCFWRENNLIAALLDKTKLWTKITKTPTIQMETLQIPTFQNNKKVWTFQIPTLQNKKQHHWILQMKNQVLTF